MVDDRANVESKKGPFAARTGGEIGHDWPLPQRELSGDGGGGGGGGGGRRREQRKHCRELRAVSSP